MPRPTGAALWPALALTFNAFAWGTSWFPLRWLQAHGLHPLWSTALIYAIVVALILCARPRAFTQLLRTPALWVLVAAAGTTNATFNWGVVIGDVVHVVLLFYLMPVWAVLLARALLGEAITPAALARVALALAGAAVVLWPADASWAAFAAQSSLADALGLVGGFSFALNNVMLRRHAGQPAPARALAMFAGGGLVSGLLATLLATHGGVPWPPAAGGLALAPVVGALVLLFLGGNLALQYGASRLSANATAVVMLGEVLFAALSSVALGAARLDERLLVGGAMIVAAALLSALGPRAAAHD